MPNPKGNPDFKAKYGEPTKVVRLPQSIADDVVTLLRAGNSTDEVLKELNSVTLLHKKLLPEVSAVYLVYQQTLSGNKLLYVGRAKNLRSRWMNHDRFKQLAALEDTHIAWFECDIESQPVVESTLIDCLTPEFNNTPLESSNAFSFRLSPTETDWILEQALDGETQHQTAQRLIRGLYQQSQGKPVKESVRDTTATVDSLEERLVEMKASLYGELADQLNGLLDARLGELPA